MATRADLTGQILEGEVTDMSVQGLGVIRHAASGCVFFVGGAWPGDVLKFRVTEMTSRYGVGQIIEMKHPSTDRRSSPCPYHGFTNSSCGGCNWMGIQYTAQLREKQKIIQSQFERFRVEAPISMILPSPNEFGYRNRGQIKTDGTKLGFVVNNSKVIADIDHCIVLDEATQKKMTMLRAMLPNSQWKPTGDHTWNFIDIDKDMPEPPVMNRRRPFQQGNTAQNAAMKNWVRTKLNENMSPSCRVLELFAGSGNFTSVLWDAGYRHITAAEAGKEATSHLEKQFPEIKTATMDIYKRKSWPMLRSGQDCELLLLDPPRSGFADLSIFIRPLKQLKFMIYISCDVQSFIRDIKPILSHGWKVLEIQPVDLFPQTPHIETLCLLKAPRGQQP